jgi:thiosulfate/3-mercaptopyruvate sulfurtransferase
MSSLITTAQLADTIKTQSIVIIDCQTDLMERERSYQLYHEQHIPGAVYAHLEDDLSSEIIPGKTGRHPLPNEQQLQGLLRRSGIEDDSHIVIYDQSNGMFAVRAWWLFKWAGLENVQVLSGGLQAWKDNDGEVTDEVPTPPQSDITIQIQPGWVVSAQEIADAHDSILLLDARALPRYLGETEPLDNKAGHIPGAWNADFTRNLQPDGTFRPVAELKDRFTPLQTQTRSIVCYCGSGVTACHNILAMTESGLPMPKLYPGSWSEWSANEQYPIATQEEGTTL